MTIKTARWFGFLSLILVLAINFYMRQILPDTPMAVHFDINGRADRFALRDSALWLMPGLMAGLWLLLGLILPAILPKDAKLERSERAYGAILSGLLMLMLVIDIIMLTQAQNPQINGVKFIVCGVGVLFVIIGNFMPKMRRNYIMGVRTPWTLSDERVWDKTHQFSGPVFMLAGLIIPIAALFLEGQFAVFALAGIIVFAAGISVTYSYLMAKKLGVI